MGCVFQSKAFGSALIPNPLPVMIGQGLAGGGDIIQDGGGGSNSTGHIEFHNHRSHGLICIITSPYA